MVKIVPWADRKLSRRSLAKIWNLFPNEEICMVEIPSEYKKLQWAKIIARYYILRGKDFSIEIDPIKQFRETEEFLKIGVKKFYFIWSGITSQYFFSSLDTISYSINIVQRFKDVFIYIIYSPPYNFVYATNNLDKLETSITFLSNSVNEFENIKCLFRACHPLNDRRRKRVINYLNNIVEKYENIETEDKCGCNLITPNTNIYCCPFCQRKKRKKLFGNADRDKFVCGTLDRGIFREIYCNQCDIKGGE